MLWGYIVSLARAVVHLRRSQPRQHERVLQAYLFGGEAGLAEKARFVEALRQATGRLPGSIGEDVLPPYFRQLLEVATRFAMRPEKLIVCAQYAEFLAEGVVAHGKDVSVPKAFGPMFDDVAAKMVNDVFALIAKASGIEDGFEKRLVSVLRD